MASSSQTATQPINVKLLLIGNSSVGKSSLLLRFSDEQWVPEDEASATIGVDFRVHKMDVDGKKVKLSIWDTAGQERFRTITSSYYRGAHGVILVYDVANRESFDALPRWYNELETYVNPKVVKMVVGNKVDKEYSRQVTYSEGQHFATRMNSLFFEASAKTAVGVADAFKEVVRRIVVEPELVGGDKPKAAKAATAKAAGTASGTKNQTRSSTNMPGTITLDDVEEDVNEGGCGC